MIEGLVSLDEQDWRRMRYLCEGICPQCHGVMTRIPEIFPKDSIVKPKENQT